MEMVGFVGLGLMGAPMALRLVRSGQRLLVWNRTPAKSGDVLAAGAEEAGGVADVFDRCDVVLLMLADVGAISEVLDGAGGATPRLSGHIVVAMGTMAPQASVELESRIRAAGGHYVEAPVSGSSVPAQRGELVGMLAGEAGPVELVRPLLAPLCRQIVECGSVPGALRLKLAVNHYLVTTVAALSETVHLARRSGIDLDALAAVLDGGPMASEVSRLKLAKARAGDFTAQAAIADVAYNCELIAAEAERVGVQAPLLRLCGALYADSRALGHGSADMIAVLRAIEARDLDHGQGETVSGTAESSNGPSSRPTTVSGVTDR